MGEVLKAKDTRLQRTVAVKVLPTHLSSDAERRGRFEREARAASALNHPNITTVYDIGEDEGTHYIVMELVEGKTFRELMEDAPLSTEKMLPLATQIAEGLSTAHAAGIVHRDLKPENLMLREDGLVKILDFGLAKLMPESSDVDSETATVTRATQQGVVMGTVQYMSPEQASNRPLDFRSDQFSFGSILYEMATGKLAFKKDTMQQTLAAIIYEDPEPISKLHPEVPVELSAIVKRCLSKDPDERYELTGDLVKELKSVPETPSVWRARRKFIWTAAGLLIAFLAIALGPNLIRIGEQISSQAGPSPIESIAVLPLQNLSGDPEQEYFVDGITEALITDLAKISALKVISRNSAMRYKDTDKSIPEIAEELGVDAIIEGSVLREGDRVRVTAQLVEAKTDQYLWADNFDRELREVMALYSEVARTIAREIEINVAPEEERRLASVRPVDPEAYEAYLKGKFHWGKMGPGDLETALQYFELALEKDPDYAPAHAGTARVWATLSQFGLVPHSEANPKAKAAALRAVELDTSLAVAHSALASVRAWGEWDWEGADEAFRRAIELNPSDPDARAFYSHFLNIMKRPDEAMAQIERAVELDPLNPNIRALYSIDLLFARRYDDAIAQAQNALRTAPNHLVAMDMLFCGYHAKGMYEEHLATMKAYYAAFGLSEVEDALARGYAEAGYPGAMNLAAEALAAASETGSALPTEVAKQYIFAGNNDRALEWLERSFEAHDPNLPYVGFPVYDGLRDDPRFKDILRRMNLPMTSARSDPDEQR
jgi:serine/threonine-protein kinase